MPIVTAITQQKRRQDRYAIHVDGSYSFSLSANQLIDAGLRVGDELSQAALEALTGSAEAGRALDQAYGFITYRSRSRQEAAIYLRRKGYAEPLVAKVLGELEQRRLIDDTAFAANWIAMRQELSPRSHRQLQAELRQKGVDSQIIEQALGGLDGDAEVRTVIELITKKRLLQRYAEPQKLYRYLAGKGFRSDVIRAALEQLEQLEP